VTEQLPEAKTAVCAECEDANDRIFTEHWMEFWAGDNPAAPGSWVFGSFPVGVGRE
jgi:hypothetical protein